MKQLLVYIPLWPGIRCSSLESTSFPIIKRNFFSSTPSFSVEYVSIFLRRRWTKAFARSVVSPVLWALFLRYHVQVGIITSYLKAHYASVEVYNTS